MVWPAFLALLGASLTCAGFFGKSMMLQQVESTGITRAIPSVATLLPSILFWASLAPLLLVFIGIFIAWQRRSWVCVIQGDRLIVSSGILFRRTDNLELYRIRDIAVMSHIWRLFGVGDLLLITTDLTDQSITMPWMKDPHALMEMIRHQAEDSRRRAGIVGLG
jgi:hypothetical protein